MGFEGAFVIAGAAGFVLTCAGADTDRDAGLGGAPAGCEAMDAVTGTAAGRTDAGQEANTRLSARVATAAVASRYRAFVGMKSLAITGSSRAKPPAATIARKGSMMVLRSPASRWTRDATIK